MPITLAQRNMPVGTRIVVVKAQGGLGKGEVWVVGEHFRPTDTYPNQHDGRPVRYIWPLSDPKSSPQATYLDHFEIVPSEIIRDGTLRMRNGWGFRVTDTKSIDPERPLVVEVDFPDYGTRVLHYLKSGYFYKDGMESGIDLVNQL